jgi:nicotinamidase-related amidase
MGFASITSQNAVLLVVDQQEGLFRRIYQPDHIRRNLIALARCAKLLGVPVVMTTGLDVCAQLPALAVAAEGQHAYVVIDACGRFEPEPSVATVSRLTQAGVALVSTRVLVLEMMADNVHPKAREIYATLPAGLVATEANPATPRPAHSATERS